MAAARQGTSHSMHPASLEPTHRLARFLKTVPYPRLLAKEACGLVHCFERAKHINRSTAERNVESGIV
jgi:hypothetical protein